LKVKLLDLSGQYKKIRKEALSAIKAVCDSQRYILADNVVALETEIAAYCGVKYAVAVASGSDAILLALKSLGVGPGDKVITTPYTFFSTAGSISLLGATPVFVDIDPRTYNISVASLEELLKKKKRGEFKAVMPVHLYGQCADMTNVNRVARGYGIFVVEDAAQAIGAAHKGRNAGSMGNAGCLSFYPTKNLGCFGDGGMITTNAKSIADTARMLRVHGSKVRYYHELVGFNSRLDEIQASVLRIKLRYLDAWAGSRAKNAAVYSSSLKGLQGLVTLPYVEEGNRMVFNQFVARVKDRDALRRHLDSKGIGSEIYYPVPLHMQKCFKDLGYRKGDFPESEAAAKETIALPIYPELKKEELLYVAESIREFYGK